MHLSHLYTSNSYCYRIQRYHMRLKCDIEWKQVSDGWKLYAKSDDFREEEKQLHHRYRERWWYSPRQREREKERANANESVYISGVRELGTTNTTQQTVRKPQHNQQYHFIIVLRVTAKRSVVCFGCDTVKLDFASFICFEFAIVRCFVLSLSLSLSLRSCQFVCVCTVHVSALCVCVKLGKTACRFGLHCFVRINETQR